MPDFITSARDSADNKQELFMVSTTFNPVALLGPSSTIPDEVLKSSDGVLFYVHRHVLLAASSNAFAGLPFSGQTTHVDVPETSAVLNIILHTVYDLSCATFNPVLETLTIALDRMGKYGLAPRSLIDPTKAIFSVIYAQAPLRPIETFILAAHYDIELLAQLASGHLLSFSLDRLSDEMVDQMGGRYLKRLFLLHRNRMTQLKEIIITPPEPGPGCTCRPGVVQSAWAMAAISLVNDAKPDLSPHLLISTMKMGLAEVSCTSCKQVYVHAVESAGSRWAMVPATI